MGKNTFCQDVRIQAFRCINNSVVGKENNQSSVDDFSELEKSHSNQVNEEYSITKQNPASYYTNIQPVKSKNYTIHNSEKKINGNSRNFDNFGYVRC